jgi:hypothetical protein
VPGGNSTTCHRILVGLANGRNKQVKASLPNVMNGVRKHMRGCMGATGIAILVTDIWDKTIFLESINDISSLKSEGKKFIFLLVNGRRLVPMDFTFL